MATLRIARAVRGVARRVHRRHGSTLSRPRVARAAVASCWRASPLPSPHSSARALSFATRPVLSAEAAVGDPTVPNNVDGRCIGLWEGTLSVNGSELRMVWRVPATIDAPPPGQGAPAVCMFDFPDAFQCVP